MACAVAATKSNRVAALEAGPFAHPAGTFAIGSEHFAELLRLQKERKAKEAEALAQAAQAYLLATHRKQPVDLAAFGFEFSTQQFQSYLAALTAARKQELLQQALKGESESLPAAA